VTYPPNPLPFVKGRGRFFLKRGLSPLFNTPFFILGDNAPLKHSKQALGNNLIFKFLTY
jgi:hypothetical protein